VSELDESPVVARIRDVVAPIVSDLGLELYDLEFGAGLLKVTVDTPPGSAGGVDVDQLTRCTRLINREFEHSDPVPGNYTLEVSSPGLERNLRLPRHFEREIGKSVAVRLRDVVNGERRVNGTLVAADAAGFTVRLDDLSERTVAYEQVDRARTVFVWEAAPKPGRPGKPGSKSAAKKTRSSTAESTLETVQESDES
jgi:ribosome maturation factor RimP